MELMQREAADAGYASIPGNTSAPWYRRRRNVVGAALAVLIVVVVLTVVLFTSAKGNRIPVLPSLEWCDGCPKSAPECPHSFQGVLPPLLLFSIDGFRPDYLERGLTPTLRKLSLCGVRTPYMQSVFPTKTFPNHFSQVTGLYPAWHGIVDNFMNDSGKVFKLGSQSTFDPFWWEAEPIWVSAVKQGKRAATFFWPGADVRINGTRPNYYKIYSGSIPFEDRVDQVLQWLDLDPSDRPSLITIYLDEPDTAGHRFGIHSKEVDEALVKVDRIIERLFVGLQMRNLTDCVNVLFMSDHGMTDMDCSRVINIGDYTDVSAIRNTEGSIGRVQVLEGANATLESVFEDLRCRNEHMRVYFKDQLPVRAHYANNRRIEPIFLDVDSGYTLLRKNPKSKERKRKCSGGTHGYDNLFPEMRAFFTAIGPFLKRNFTADPFINTELYELMCELIGITPNPNNGTKGSLHHLLKAPLRLLENVTEPRSIPIGIAEHDPQTAECPCNPAPNPQVEISESFVLHLPFAAPESSAENDHLLLLHNSDYVLSYDTKQKMAAWAAFTLSPQTQLSNPGNVCWSGDPRLPAEETAKCTDYDSPIFRDRSIFQRTLYDAGFSNHSTQQEAMFVSNSIPKSLNHTALEAKMTNILSRWSSEEGPIHVLTGPAFDLLATGIKPAPQDMERAKIGPLLIPTHLFLVITWCSDKTNDLRYCDPHRLRANAFLLPNWHFSFNCEMPETTIGENVARVVDVEKLTGLSLYRGLPVYEAVRLRTSLPDDHWRTFV